MTLIQKLKDQGWYLTEDGLKKLTTDEKTEDPKRLIQAGLDWDLKEIAGGALPIKPETNGSISGRIVLQIQKMRNISAPKANEESTAAPRFLQLELSDGVTSVAALELEKIPSLNLNVPPGTKLFFKSDKLQFMQGFLMLKSADVQLLGGNVEHMVEKWEVARQMQKYARSNRRISGSGGPPPWIAFGKRLDAHKEALPTDRNFKSLQAATEKDKNNTKENDEFNATRSQVIAEAAKSGQKKVFGGGQRQILDHNVKKILEKGYSEEEAKLALKSTNNNLERALYNLKRRNTPKAGSVGSDSGTSKPPAVMSGGRQRNGMGAGGASAKDEALAAKPQGNVSLFDFLTDKLPVTVSTSTTTSQPPPAPASQSSANSSQYANKSNRTEPNKAYNSNNSSTAKSNNNSSSSTTSQQKFENNMSSSFATRGGPYSPSDNNNRYHQQQQQNRNNNYQQRDERKSHNPMNNRQQQATAGGVGGGRPERNPRNDKFSNAMTANNSNENATSSAASTGYNSNRRNDRNDRGGNERNDRNDRYSAAGSAQRKEREQTPKQTTAAGNHQQQNRRNDYKTGGDNKNYQNRENHARSSSNNYQNAGNNNNNNTQQNQPKSNAFENAINKLVDSTSKMSIQNKNNSYNAPAPQQYHHQQQQQQHQRGGARQNSRQAHHQSSNNQSQSNFMGSNTSVNQQQQQSPNQFINSQNFSNQSQQQQQQQQQKAAQHAANVAQPPPQQTATFITQLPNGFAYDPNKIMGFQSPEANEYAMNMLKSQGMQAIPAAQPANVQHPNQTATAAPPQPQILSSAQVQAPPMTFMAAPPQQCFVPQAPPPPAQYQMMPGSNWPWKVGDLCMAKYWDDGNYYEAKVTGFTDKTCVVFFSGYGNYEEVLKSDCLPITDAQHQTVNTYQQPAAMATHLLAQPPPPPPQTFQRGHNAGGGSQRYRGERQMYVPPQKRGGN